MSVTISDYQKLVMDSTGKENGNIDIEKDKLKITTDKPQTNVVEHLKTALKTGNSWSDEQINSALSVLPKGKDGITIADLKSVLGKLESFEKNMNKDGAMAGIFDLAILLAELQKICLTTRNNAQEAAKTASELQVKMTHEQANQIANAAGWALAAGIISGVMQIASGSIQVVGAGVGVAAGAFVGGGCGGKDGMALFKIINTLISSITKGMAEATSGLGKLAEAGLNSGSQFTHAVEVWAQSEATKAGAKREEQLKFAENMQEAIRAAIQALGQVIQSREQVVQKIYA